jgi:hypothetical protein
MQEVLKSIIDFPQGALLVGNNHIHNQHPVAYIPKRNGILHQKLIFAQPVKQSFLIT